MGGHDVRGADPGAAAGGRIRVAMVHGPAPPEYDGVSDYTVRLAAELASVDVEVRPVPVRPAGGTGWLTATARAAGAVRRLRPDLVHVQFAPSAYRFSGVPGLLPPLIAGVGPLVTTVHEYGWWAAPGWVPDPVWRWLEHVGWWDRETGRLVPASSAVVATNPDHAHRLRARTGAEPLAVPIAPNVVPAPDPPARQLARARLAVDPAAPVLAFFGFVHPVKGLRYVIEALPRLRAAHPGLHLLVVGGFTSQALPPAEAAAFARELRELAGRYGVADAVTFTGHLPATEVCATLAAADLAVLPFTGGVTTKSGALLTVLGLGLPTAVTLPDQLPPPPAPLTDDGAGGGGGDVGPGSDRTDGPRDDGLRDGDTVAVIPGRRDADAVARTVARLLADPALRRRLADGGRRLAAGHCWPRVVAAHRALYERVLRRAESAAPSAARSGRAAPVTTGRSGDRR